MKSGLLCFTVGDKRVAIVLHELFHRWYASALYAKKRAFVDAVQASNDLSLALHMVS